MPRLERTVNPRKQGDAGLGIAICWFATNGYTVCVPLTDSQDYDLIVDCGEGLCRVQVRTTTAKSPEGIYVLRLVVTGGNRSGIGKTKRVCDSEIEFVFAVTAEHSYLIPARVLANNRTMVNLGRKVQQYRVE